MLENHPVSPELPPESTLESGQKAAASLIRNSTFYLGAEAVIKLLSFVFNIYVVRQLGDERFGYYSTVLAYVGIFSIIGDLGMTQYVTREIARRRRRVDELFWDLVAIRLILSTLATIFIVTSAVFVAGYQAEMAWGIGIACVSLFLYAFFGPINIVLVGHERIDNASVLNVVIQMFFIGLGAWVLLAGYSFYGLIVASYIGVPVAALVGAVRIKKLKLATFKFQINPRSWLSLLKYSLPFALVTFTLLVGRDVDTVLLSLWRSPEEVGWYKAAYNLIFKFLFVQGALLASLTPQLSRYYGVSKERVAKTFNTSVKVFWALSFPVAVGGTLLAEPIIIWLFSDAYSKSVSVFVILIWSLPFLALSSLCGSISMAADKEKHMVKVYAGAAMLNVVVNLAAIPRWGYLGAAVATVLTEAITLVMFYSVLYREFPLTDIGNSLLKPFMAGIIMAGVLLAFVRWPLFEVAPAGVVVYVAVLLFLQPFNQVELEIIQGLWLTLRERFRYKRA